MSRVAQVTAMGCKKLIENIGWKISTEETNDRKKIRYFKMGSHAL
jgi:hypothetical protein